MKKYIIVGLIVLVGTALIVVPMFKERPNDIEFVPEEEAPALFVFQDDLALVVDQAVKIEVEVKSEDVEKIELRIDDVVINTWNNPKGKLSYDFKASAVGAKHLDLLSTLKDGSTYVDNRMMRILSDIEPELLMVEVVNRYPHNSTSYTQGLEFYKGRLFESTGLYGKSWIQGVDLESGKRDESKKIGLDGNYFGEGITILNDIIYQLTWKEKKCFTYDLNEEILLKGEFLYEGEGWGLCNDGTSLIMSNGTERLTFRNPENFAIEKTIDVYNNLGPIHALNELEFIDGKIYANVYTTNVVVVIDPSTGKVLQEIDGTTLAVEGRGMGEVMNGIALNHQNGKIYMTGKNWTKLFEVKFVKPAA